MTLANDVWTKNAGAPCLLARLTQAQDTLVPLLSREEASRRSQLRHLQDVSNANTGTNQIIGAEGREFESAETAGEVPVGS